MGVIANKWIHKEGIKKTKKVPTAPSYESERRPDMLSAERPNKRSSKPLRATLVKTLRGVRK